MKREPFIVRLGRMYVDAFRSSSLTRGMILLIAVKLFIMFAIIKTLFFPNLLGRLDSDEQRAKAVVGNLTAPVGNNRPYRQAECRTEPVRDMPEQEK